MPQNPIPAQAFARSPSNAITQVRSDALGNVYASLGGGTRWSVNTVSGLDTNAGTVYAPFKTMSAALAVVASNDTIEFVGTVREQLVAPLGVRAVTIIGAVGGNVRDDDGAKWTVPASPVAGKALLEILEQGWVFENFLMTPDATGGACIKAHRAESATYPDSSHFICRKIRFVGAGGTPIGIEDVGGNHHYVIDDCEFQTLTNAIYCSSTSIAVPLRNTITNNKFYDCTNDINSSQSYGRIEGNRFFTDSTVTINTVANAAQGGYNIVTGNVFPNAIADIDPAHGYTGAATDVWTGNLVTDQAAFAYGVPA